MLSILKKIYFYMSLNRKLSLLFIFNIFFSQNIVFSDYILRDKIFKLNINNQNISDINDEKFKSQIGSIKWKKLEIKKNPTKIKWNELKDYEIKNIEKSKGNIIFKDANKNSTKKSNSLNSLNRSVVFNNKIIGPDINWLVPPGLQWNEKYKWDFSVRGHNRRKKGEPFFGWNGGDAVGQFYYQPLIISNYSVGINLGIRSIYSGSARGGTTEIGEGLSLGFRLDKKLSNTSGLAFGAEQLLHFDGLTDTGRDIYITATKGWLSKDEENIFPLSLATFGFGTGKLAEGNVKGLCSNLMGGSGTEVDHQRRLCWSPIFSLARVYSSKFSTFFEYNSKWFLIGSSISPSETIPLRGTFAIQLSDHIDNYKINKFSDIKYVFRLSMGF